MSKMELANFVCKFGEDKVLADYYDQIVIPAFRSKERKRWRNNHYYLYEISFTHATKRDGNTTPIIYGRLAKNTILVSKQVEENNKLVRRTEKMKSSPSSFFVFYVESHKLAYVPEMGFAPSISDFEYTMAWLLKKYHRQFLKKLQAAAKNLIKRNGRTEETPKVLTLKELLEINPAPTLTITPIGTKESLAKFVNSYDALKQVTIELLPVNEEVDRKSMYQAVRNEMGLLNSSKTKISHGNLSGLNKDNVIEDLESLVEDANHKITMSGTDSNGNLQTGTNVKFKVQRSIGFVPDDEKNAQELVHGEILQLINAGAIKWPL